MSSQPNFITLSHLIILFLLSEFSIYFVIQFVPEGRGPWFLGAIDIGRIGEEILTIHQLQHLLVEIQDRRSRRTNRGGRGGEEGRRREERGRRKWSILECISHAFGPCWGRLGRRVLTFPVLSFWAFILFVVGRVQTPQKSNHSLSWQLSGGGNPHSGSSSAPNKYLINYQQDILVRNPL